MVNQANDSSETAVVLAGKYEILAEIGRGGMGIVLKGRHTGLNKQVAIKVLNTTLLVDKLSRARFEQEAQAGAKLSHPNLVSVIDCGFTPADEPYLVMEYVEGVPLDHRITSLGRLSVDSVLDLLIPIAKALKYLHENGIVHRDLKTSNIMVQEIGGDTYSRLLDLGIAKVLSDKAAGTQLTSTGMLLGSPGFMSPEQCQGQQTDARSDIYSFGCVVYECITGHLPFSAENALQIMFKHLNEPPAPFLCKVQRDAELWLVVQKCLEKDPAKRYQHVGELIQALAQVRSCSAHQRVDVQNSASRSYSNLSRPTGISPVNPEKEEPQRSFYVVATMLIAAVILGTVGVSLWYYSVQTKALTEQATKAKLDAEKAIADKIAVEKAAAEKVAHEQALARLAAAKATQEAERKAADARRQATLMAEAKAAAERAAEEEHATKVQSAAASNQQVQEAYRAGYLAKLQALTAEQNKTFALTSEQLARMNGSFRAIDQVTENTRRTNQRMQQLMGQPAQPAHDLNWYNDQMARRNHLPGR